MRQPTLTLTLTETDINKLRYLVGIYSEGLQEPQPVERLAEQLLRDATARTLAEIKSKSKGHILPAKKG